MHLPIDLNLLLLAFGGLAGLTTVLFGFGGGFVAVPLLYAMFTAVGTVPAQAMHVAVATSTAVMIVGAGFASLRHARAGSLDMGQLLPLILPVSLGAVIGARAAISFGGEGLRAAFIAYLGLTILDCLFRPGFMTRATRLARPMRRRAAALIGLGIGAIAAFLGVGGSVMTVPLLRRRGADMTTATAMASPLSLPMAVAGTMGYVGLAEGSTGYVDAGAFLALAIGSTIGVRLSAPLIGRLPDRLHARAYLVLLTLVLVVMVLL